MIKFKRITATFIIPVFFLGVLFSCQPNQVNTAKNVMQQSEFYIQLAEQLITVASTQFSTNVKVKTALTATKQALAVVRSALATASSGLDKDMQALQSAIVSLAVEVFGLVNAINEAKKANK